MNLIMSTEITPREEALIRYKDHQLLEADPWYLAAKIGTIHLLTKDKVSNDPNPIKISIKKTTSTMTVTESSFVQGIWRAYSGESRAEINLIRPHLIKLLRWFDYQKEPYCIILKICKLGLQTILEGYEHANKKEIVITQKIVPLKEGDNQSRRIKLSANNRKTDFVVRALQDDIKLLDVALKKKTEEEQQLFVLKLAEEEAEYFPLHTLEIGEKEAKSTIDVFLQKEITNRWPIETLQGIGKFFQADSQKSFNRFESIESLVKRIPENHLKSNEHIQKLVENSFENCEFLSQMPEKVKNKDEQKK